MQKSRKLLLVISFILLAALTLSGCGQTDATSDTSTSATIDKTTITAAGSTALQPLVKIAADDFMKTYSQVQVNVSGGGSMTGLNNVAAGSIDIGNSDVVVTTELQDKGLVDHQVCVAPFLIIVNKDVSVDNLTQAQLIDIFTGKITNWKDVGGKDQKISIIGRASSSGTRATIKAVVLKGAEFTAAAAAQDSTGNLLTAVGQTPGAIGYIDAAYLKDTVKALKYNGVEYTADNVYAGKYPIFAYEHMYTKGEASGTVKAFLDLIASSDFQVSIEKSGFLSSSKMKK